MEPNSQRPKVRPPAAAGLFYASDPDRLRASVAELIGAVEASAGVASKALIAPHAGYVYSGSVAAEAFARLRVGAHAIKRVVLIGPAHFVPVRGIAAPTVEGGRPNKSLWAVAIAGTVGALTFWRRHRDSDS